VGRTHQKLHRVGQLPAPVRARAALARARAPPGAGAAAAAPPRRRRHAMPPHPPAFYAKVAGVCFAMGAGMEAFMVKTGFYET
jgi:hypothetical protein